MALFFSKSLNAMFDSAVTSLDKFPADVVEWVEEVVEDIKEDFTPSNDIIPVKKSKPVTVAITPAITPVVVEATVATDSTVATPITTA